MELKREKVSNIEEKQEDHPSPLEFDTYLPWACGQLLIPSTVVVTRVLQQQYFSVSTMSDRNKLKTKSRAKLPSRTDLDSDQEADNKSLFAGSDDDQENIIRILAFYDSSENLVQLQFDKNNYIPRLVFKIIGLIIPYQVNLTTITINRGMDQYSIYEICKLLPLSHLTEICLDNCFIKEGNYYMLLEQPNLIRHLSLARCSISDDVVEALAETLVYPQPSSKTLSILNLSSNRITDVGAKHLSEALRSNRQLSYLNLASNMISDTGAYDILNTLVSFPLTFNELLTSRSRHMAYLKEKNEVVLRIARELRAGDFDRRSMKRKSIKSAPSTKKSSKGVEKEPSLKCVVETKSITTMDAALLEKASIMATNTLGEFKDPFNKSNTYVENDIVYSHGNNTLCYLNMSYNSLSYTSVKKLLYVLGYQNRVGRKPRGLVNLSIEGNCFPLACHELASIDYLLDVNLSIHQRKVSSHKKRTQSKTSAK